MRRPFKTIEKTVVAADKHVALNLQGGKIMCASIFSYLDTREKASAQMAGQGTKRMAMRPSAAG